MFYNIRVKHYSDGTRQYFYCEKPIETEYKREEKKKTGETIERKKKENMKRSIQKVYDYAKNNKFDYFVTLTFDPQEVDSFSYDSCVTAIKCFTDILRHSGCKWLMVPELHESGRYHFHGLIQGSLKLESAINPHTGSLLLDGSGRQIYNIKNYQYGFTTATEITDHKRTASYIAKYISKEMCVPKGKKKYWASKSLQLPKEEYLQMTTLEMGEIMNQAEFTKVIQSPYGGFVLFEVGEQNSV